MGTGPGRALGPPDLWTHRRHARGPPMAHLEEQPLTRGPQSFLDLSDQNANSVGFLFSSWGTAAPGQSSEASYSKAGVRAQRRRPWAPGLLPQGGWGGGGRPGAGRGPPVSVHRGAVWASTSRAPGGRPEPGAEPRERGNSPPHIRAAPHSRLLLGTRNPPLLAPNPSLHRWLPSSSPRSSQAGTSPCFPFLGTGVR